MSLSGKTMFNPLLGRASRRWPKSRRAISRSRFGATAGPKRSRARSSSRAPRPAGTKIVSTVDAFHGKTHRRALGERTRNVSRRRSARCSKASRTFPTATPASRRRACRMPLRSSSSRCRARAGSTFRRTDICAPYALRATGSGALFVADEVQTGLGRCGVAFACDRDGVVPDVMTLAKGLSGASMPVGAFIARPQVWTRAYGKAPLSHTSTFGGGELACAAALAAIDVLDDDGFGWRTPASAARNCSRVPGDRGGVSGGRSRRARPGLLVGVELRERRVRRAGSFRRCSSGRDRRVDAQSAARHSARAAADRDRSRSRRALEALRQGRLRAREQLGVSEGHIACRTSRTTIDGRCTPRSCTNSPKIRNGFRSSCRTSKSSSCSSATPDRVISRWKTLVEGGADRMDRRGPLRRRTAAHRLPAARRRSRQVRRRVDVRRTATARTHVTLGVDYDFGVPTLAELIGPTLEKKVRENSEMMLAALKKEAEEIAVKHEQVLLRHSSAVARGRGALRARCEGQGRRDHAEDHGVDAAVDRGSRDRRARTRRA